MIAAIRWLLLLVRRRRVEEELDDEMTAHLELAAADQVASGLSPAEARRVAAGRFGGVLQTAEAHRDARTLPLVESLWLDALYGLRTLRRQPAFTAVVLIVLAIVIGLNTSLFTLAAGLLYRPWAGMRMPERVVTIVPVDTAGRAGGFSVAEARFLENRVPSLSGVAVMRPDRVDLGRRGALGKTGAFLVSGNLFEVLGVVMARGRGFTADEDRSGAPRAVAVLGYALWQARFGADPAIVGTSIAINDVPFTVVGIAPGSFAGPEPRSANLFLPIASASLLRPNDPTVSNLLYDADDCCSDLVGRLAPGSTRDRASRELDSLHRVFRTDVVRRPLADNAGDWHITVQGTEFLARPGRKNAILALVALLAAGLLLVWLLACANIGNLHIARAIARSHELSTRLALGASRARIVRQLLIEGFVLSLGAAALGVGLAYVLPVLVVRALAEGATPFSLAPDMPVLVYAVVFAGVSAVAFGLAPALHATRPRVAHTLWLRNILLGAQIALSVILLVSAGLLVRRAERTASFDAGFSRDAVAVTFETPTTYDQARIDALVAHFESALSPWRGTFAFASLEPLAQMRQMTATQALGASTRPMSTAMLSISPEYFDVLRIPLVAGRRFETSRRDSVIVNESLARLYWPNENAVGRTLLVGSATGLAPREVVGVARDAYTASLSTVSPTVYLPIEHLRWAPALLLSAGTRFNASRAVDIAARFDPRVTVRTTRLADEMDKQLQPLRYGATVAVTLGVSALLLATVGTFGVFMYSVRQRTREIGVRVALGARPWAVVRLILAGQTHALLWGLAAGIGGAAAASAILRNLVYGIRPLDPVVYVGVVGALVVAGLMASYVPARRATRIDPATALRYE